jgi:uncharacterized protein
LFHDPDTTETIMSDEFPKLNRPYLVATWPGMGGVAINAGVYLLAKLGMELIADFQAAELFDVEHVEVQKGIIRTGRRPRNRFFSWRGPEDGHDLVVFLGEAQPPLGKYAFCRHLIAIARQLGVERVFTFAAMGTDMEPAACNGHGHGAGRSVARLRGRHRRANAG